MNEDEEIFDDPKFDKPDRTQNSFQKNSEFQDRFKDLYKQRFNKEDKVKINRSEEDNKKINRMGSNDDISVNYSENLRNSRFMKDKRNKCTKKNSLSRDQNNNPQCDKKDNKIDANYNIEYKNDFADHINRKSSNGGDGVMKSYQKRKKTYQMVKNLV